MQGNAVTLKTDRDKDDPMGIVNKKLTPVEHPKINLQLSSRHADSRKTFFSHINNNIIERDKSAFGHTSNLVSER